MPSDSSKFIDALKKARLVGLAPVHADDPSLLIRRYPLETGRSELAHVRGAIKSEADSVAIWHNWAQADRERFGNIWSFSV